MPKVQEFSLDLFSEDDVRKVLEKELKQKLLKVSHKGMSVAALRWIDTIVSEEDLAAFMESKECESALQKQYKADIAEKKAKYDSLRKKLDYCLHDVKSYNALVKVIDEFTYCGAISELQVLETRYLRGNGYTKAKYRARAQEFNKIQCA